MDKMLTHTHTHAHATGTLDYDREMARVVGSAQQRAILLNHKTSILDSLPVTSGHGMGWDALVASCLES